MIKRVYLEIIDACNLSCPFCTLPKGASFMSFEEIKDYVKQIKEYCSYLYLHMLGEPLLHPDFERILDLLDEEGMKLQLVSNATLLKEYPGLFEHPCLRKCSLSLHSLDHYEKQEEVLSHVRTLLESDHKCTLELRLYDRKHLSASLQAFWRELEEKYGLSPTKRRNSFQLLENTFLYEEELFDWPDIHEDVISLRGRCRGEDMLSINVHGEVTICCLDPFAQNSLGNLHEKSLRDIVSSKEYQNMIRSLRGEEELSPLCSRCRYRLRFR